ncbi:MAG: TnpV protein [Clostridia bacterium]|nr:TnpV protein [Clostridia bacterium]
MIAYYLGTNLLIFFRLVKEHAEREGVTEEPKATDQMAWVGKMNRIMARVTESVKSRITG